MDDKEAIFKLIRIAYEDWESRIPDRWNWQFVDNPYLENNTDLNDNLPIWIVLDDAGNVVGQACAMIEPVKLGSELLKIGWGVDYYVCSNHRGKGVGKLVQKYKYAGNRINMGVLISPAAVNIVKQIGAVTVAKMWRYRLNIIPKPIRKRKKINDIFKRILSISLLSKAIAFFIDRWMIYKGKYAKLKKFDFVQVDYFGTETDRLWDKLSSEFDCAAVRNSEYLNWKYVKQPHVSYDLFLVKRKGEVVGYIILRTKGKEGLIVDFLLSPEKEKVIISGLTFAIRYFLKNGISNIRVATSVKKYAKCIDKIGIPWSKKNVTPIFFSDNRYYMERAKTDRWLLSLGDADQQR